MSETAEGRKSSLGDIVGDFKALNKKQWISVILALVVALVLQAIGSGMGCLMFLIIAVVLYMFPHLAGVSSVKVKAVVGVVFVILAVLIGTFAYTGSVQTLEDSINQDSNGIRDITYDEETGTLDFYAVPSLPTDAEGNVWNVTVRIITVDSYAFGLLYGNASEPVDITSTGVLQDDGWYRFHYECGTYQGQAYGFELRNAVTHTDADGNEDVEGYVSMFLVTDGSSALSLCLKGACYIVAFSAVLFFIILIFSALMRRSVEKTRVKMEEEGRLYPQGYGRCKECGAMVLPGEVNCRKCGAYIDVPDELRVKKKDFFQCSECGAEVPADAIVCPRCGAKFDEAQENVVVHEDGTEDVSTENVVCPECGATVPANADWCPRCGKMLKKRD